MTLFLTWTRVTALTLLDLSAAFDTLDHSSITNLLSTWYGIDGIALDWFVSYLSDRKQKVKLMDCLSSAAEVACGVPQGSVLGPLLFTLYTLKLHPDKTEFLLIGSKVQREKFSKCFPTRLLAQEVTPSPSARNLSIVFDNALNIKNHISGISHACYYHIRDMRRIRRFLTPSAKTIETSLIGRKLDYCNSVLFNVTEKDISKLQGVQNCLARVVTKSPLFYHITPLLKSLHWLPVRYRINFKLCSLTYQALTSGQPLYIRNMLQPSRKVRTLRSSDLDQLNVPRVRTAVGSRAFFVVAPRLWNELPLEIRKLVSRRNWKLIFWSGFSDLNPRWSGWPRQQTQTVFGTMSRITIMFVAPLSSDHRGFRRYRSLLLLLL